MASDFDPALVSRINSDDPEMVMPPPKTKKTLTAAQKDLLKRWIAAGAEYQPHWSFLPPARPVPPAVKHAARLPMLKAIRQQSTALRSRKMPNAITISG